MYGSESASTPAAALCKFEVVDGRLYVDGRDSDLSDYGVAFFRELFRNPGAVRNPLALTIAVWPKVTRPDIRGINGLLFQVRRHIDPPGRNRSHIGVEGDRGAYFDPLCRADPSRKFLYASGRKASKPER